METVVLYPSDFLLESCFTCASWLELWSKRDVLSRTGETRSWEGLFRRLLGGRVLPDGKRFLRSHFHLGRPRVCIIFWGTFFTYLAFQSSLFMHFQCQPPLGWPKLWYPTQTHAEDMISPERLGRTTPTAWRICIWGVKCYKTLNEYFGTPSILRC